MKPLSYSLIAAALACGFANAQTTAYTTPVGYETLTLKAGINYAGLRLHGSEVVASTLTGVGAVGTKTITDSATTFALTTGTSLRIPITFRLLMEAPL